jgi:P27 family predicted phage terminase small subunit
MKLVTGNPGCRALNKREPRPPVALPSAPEHLSDVARAEWQCVAEELYNIGTLARIDRSMLAAYCQAYADWVEAEGKLKRFGKIIMSPKRTITKKRRDGTEVTETSGGYPQQSPYVSLRNKALAQMYRFAVEFGMSPSSRSRIEVGSSGGEADDPARKYIG